jgi:aminoglycoside 6'-N-acetyltransferase
MTLQESLSFRPVETADIPLLKRWDEQPHVKASDPDPDWNWEEEVGKEPWWREQWMAEFEGRPIGFLQLMDTAETDYGYWGPDPPAERAIDIWIGEPDMLGRGLGTLMMTWAIDRCFSVSEVQSIAIDPLVTNRRAHRFYERLGFQFLEERRFDDDLCRVYVLARKDWSTGIRPTGP